MKEKFFRARREQLRDKLIKDGLSALIVSNSANRYYLSGFELHDPQPGESAGLLVITADGKDWLCTDPRFQYLARRLWDNSLISTYKSDGSAHVNELLRREVSGPVGFEPKSTSIDAYDCLSPELDMVRVGPLVETMRQVKSAEELECIKRSCRLNHQLMEWLPSILSAGKTESAIAWSIEKFLRENGASEIAFPTIVGCGKNAALPHAIPGDTILEENSLILIDAGARLENYCSDQTRTFWVGSKPSSRFMDTLSAVREAQMRALSYIRPGVMAKEAYQAAYDSFAGLGLAEGFIHSLGHGIGLETHEGMSLGPRSEAVLAPGMVITVEPGLYDPTWGGVRWEYMVLVTEEGNQIL
jgi:Xaa-Pro aminopeptidase